MKRIAIIGLVLVLLNGCNSNGNNGISPNVVESSSSINQSNNDPHSSASDMSSAEISLSSSSGLCENTYSNGSMTDCRDGKVYAIVTIGTQTWMAKNLNYKPSRLEMGSRGCYNNDTLNCSAFGGLYAWSSAMNVYGNYDQTLLGDSINHRGICPFGWHIPRSSEWELLIATVRNVYGGSAQNAGFSALPAGKRSYVGGFYDLNESAYWWSATEVCNEYSNIAFSDFNSFGLQKYPGGNAIGVGGDGVTLCEVSNLVEGNKLSQYSLRCILN